MTSFACRYVNIKCHNVVLYVIFLPPQTEFATVMFSQVSVYPQGGWRLPLVGGGGVADTTPGQTPTWADAPCAVHAGIQSTSGRYASHWNAFLFENQTKTSTSYYFFVIFSPMMLQSIYHSAGRALISERLVNSFIMVVYEKIFLCLVRIFCSKDK